MKTRKLKNTTSYGYKKMKMDDDTYKLRRKVIDCIYKAKKLVDLPRIEVRIVEDCGKVKKVVCGYAYLNSNIVHINKDYLKLSEVDLYGLVLHEIVHAVTGFGHDDDCYLMNPYLKKGRDLNKTEDTFKKYFK